MYIQSAYHVSCVTHIMLQHGHCLTLLRNILDIVFAGDSAVRYVAELRALLLEHNPLFVHLYGVELAKPKLHTSYHIPRCLELFGVGLNCFKPERDHKSGKAFAEHCTNHKHADHSMLVRYTFDIMTNLHKISFEENHLLGPVKPYPEILPALSAFRPDLAKASCAKRVSTALGEISQNGLISVFDGSGRAIVVQAVCFVSAVPTMSSDTSFYIVCRPCCELLPGIWAPSQSQCVPCTVDILVDLLPYVCSSGGWRPLLSWHAVNNRSVRA